MTEYLTEQEQIELLKNWVKQYSGIVLFGVVFALALSAGWRYWQNRQVNYKIHASSIFDELLAARAENKSAVIKTQATKLITNYPKSPYAQMAAMMLGREAITQKDFANAEKQYTWVIAHSNTKAYRQIARLRLARVQIAENKQVDSLKTLETVDDTTFIGLIDEVRGDAYVAMNDNTAARAAYGKALAELPNAETVRPLLQIKYDNLS